MSKAISCSICGGSLRMMSDGKSLKCQDCGIIYAADSIRASIASENKDQNSSRICAEDGAESTASRLEEVACSGQPGCTPIPDPKKDQADDLPLLSGWKTSYGFSVLGALISLALSAFPIAGTIGFGITLCWLIASIIYVFSVYPSFFSETPKLHSSTTISFFNFLFGGVLFGCIWNSNLSNKRRGISNTVYGLLAIAVTVALTALSLYGWYYSNPLNRLAGQGVEYTMNDGEKAWWSNAIYFEEEDEQEQYYDAVNNYLCWSLSELADVPYDSAHEWWYNIADVEHYSASFSKEGAREMLDHIGSREVAVNDLTCDESSTHAEIWRTEATVDGKSYKIMLAHVYLHDGTGRQLHNPAPWIQVISEAS